MSTGTCTAIGCTKPLKTTTLCTACWQRRRRRGAIPGLVDREPARQHLEVLRAAGVTRETIARVSGVPLPTIQNLSRTHAPKRITEATSSAILAVEPVRANMTLRIDATGSRRRLQALAAIGWTLGGLAAHAGCTKQWIAEIRRAERVRAETAEMVTRLFAELHATPGPSSRAAELARRAGWALPMEWDDDIDDPAAQPVRSRRKGAGQRDAAEERREAVAAWLDDPRPESLPAGPRARLHDRGGLTKGTAEQLAHRLRCTPRTIERDKARIRAERAREVA